MMKLLILADDITGALDTCVKFSVRGAVAKVFVDWDMDFSQLAELDVLVLCVPTRHMDPKEAYALIRQITERALHAGIPYIFKKTDSALRGNVGAELCAVLDGSGEQDIFFIPALPGMNRITLQGVHYIDGTPVSQSVFGQDPFEPVKESYIPALLEPQCSQGVRILSGKTALTYRGSEKTLRVLDCTGCSQMDSIVSGLLTSGRLRLVAGCAGLAESLAEALFPHRPDHDPFCYPSRITVVCGSLNPISRSQMDFAEEHGFHRIHIPRDILLDDLGLRSNAGEALLEDIWNAYQAHPYFMLDTQEDSDTEPETCRLRLEYARQRIARRLGCVVRSLMEQGADSCILVIGGDTLLAFMEAIGSRELVPIRELQLGVVLSNITYNGKVYQVISKSGGFGDKALIPMLKNSTCQTVAAGIPLHPSHA